MRLNTKTKEVNVDHNTHQSISTKQTQEFCCRQITTKQVQGSQHFQVIIEKKFVKF